MSTYHQYVVTANHSYRSRFDPLDALPTNPTSGGPESPVPPFTERSPQGDPHSGLEPPYLRQLQARPDAILNESPLQNRSSTSGTGCPPRRVMTKIGADPSS